MHSVEKVIFMNDVVNSTKKWNKNGIKMFHEINRITKIITSLLKHHQGIIIKMMGDSFMIAFDDLLDCIAFAIEFQHTLYTSKTLLNKQLEFRTGIYYGHVFERDMIIQKCLVKDFFGNVINIASRLESKVSDKNSIAVGINNTRDLHSIIDYLKTKNYTYELLKYNKQCKTIKKRSLYKCKSIKLLKGVNKNIKVLKIIRKNIFN